MTESQKPRNWFMPGRTVHGDHFFGRGSELRHVSERLQSGQSVLIAGERRIGKTSLLFEVHRRFADSVPNDHLYLDAQSFGTAGRLLASVTAYLEDQAESKHEVVALESGTDPLIDTLKKFANDSRQLTIFINDFDDLLARSPESEGGRHLSSFFRSIVEEGHLMVCAVAFRSMLVEPQSPMHAPLFNVFSPLTLRVFSEDEALDLLVVNSRRSGSELSTLECRFVMELAGLHPFHLQEFGFRLFTLGIRTCSGSSRVKLFDEAANSFASTMEEHWQYAVTNLTVQQRDALVSATREEPASDPSSYSYLVKRGFLGEGSSQFSPMGALFNVFTRELGAEVQRGRTWENTVATMKGMAESAMKVAVDSAVKAILS